MGILKLLSRLLVGLLFIFSGFVKAVDPLGSTYKFVDYFQAFHLDFLKPIALPLAILMCTAEFLIGFSVLTGLRMKYGIWGSFLLMLFFTPLTLILALTNPVSDCGCFGDAIHLSNWQTFGKNIILLVMIIILLSGRKSIRSVTTSHFEWLIICLAFILFAGFSLFNLRYLPVIDFLPYKTGINIPEKMKRPEGAPADKYETTFIYEKSGEQKEFTLANYPANDTSWKFVKQKSVLVQKGYLPPIHDFTIVTLNNEDITEKVLTDPRYTLLMISKKLSEADPGEITEGVKLGMYCASNNIGFYILTASGTDEVKNYENGLTFCNTDETTLKTIVRSNPGYVLLKEGVITGKWSWAELAKLRILLENIRDK